MSDEGNVHPGPSDLDTRLADADLEALRRFAAIGEGLTSSPPFHNVFFNQFVNSPGFSKRLRRPEHPPRL